MTELLPPTVAIQVATWPCRFCGRPLDHVVVDLGMSPLCESYLSADELDRMEPFYPLRVRICAACLLVQLPAYVAPAEIFSVYAYFSSFSASWVEHARRFADEMRDELGLGERSLVVELGSNDGYLLQHFVERGIPVLGVEPAANVAAAAVARGVRTRATFFGREEAARIVGEHGRADLVIGNNVLAQVPDINDFVGGIRELLAPGGVVSVEFPHLLRLLDGNQFDTIYHEHFSYFSLGTIDRIFAAHGLAVSDVRELRSHGGSLRVFARHANAGPRSERVSELLGREAAGGLGDLATYRAFGARVEGIKRDLLTLLMQIKSDGRTIAGYGAPGKANTLLNYCGIRTDLLPFTVDRNPYKHGRYTPGTHIPILTPDQIRATRPDYVWILPWNLAAEISQQLAEVREWGGRFLTAIPRVQVS